MEVILINQTSSTSDPLTTTTLTPPLRTSSTIAPLVNTTDVINSTNCLIDREQMRVEFFRTYDVMTGVRIAATLGGFFGLMVLLVIYKSKCKTKSLSDEHLNAAAAAAVEEEDNELAATLEAAAFLSMNPRVVRGARRSLGNMSAPALVLTRGARFSSIGGYTSLEPPACFYYQRGKSLPGSALRFTQQESYCEEDELSSPPPLACPEHVDEDANTPCFYHQYLTVPSERRRLSSITCSSADTSYLERKGSACELGLPPPPPFSNKDCEKRCIAKAAMIKEPWDFYYPIDIQVIQPTPDVSPCGSERTLYDDPIRIRAHGSVAETISSVTMQRLAPLASISSLGASRTEYPPCDADSGSVGSDSVFLDDDDGLDTEDEVDGFATDSDDEKYVQHPNKYRRHSQLDKGESNAFVPYSKHFLQVPCMGYPKVVPESVRIRRRLSVPSCRTHHKARSPAVESVSSLALVRSKTEDSEIPTCSRSFEVVSLIENPVNSVGVAQRPPHPLPRGSSSSSSLKAASPSQDKHMSLELPLKNCTSVNLPFIPSVQLGSCDHLTQVIDPKSSPSPVSDNCSWSQSQETLF